jgi:L-alanine-DL-glutamate epimerase-like enolase superfamily enzyme
MIRVREAEAIPIRFRLQEGYRIAGHAFTHADNVFLRIATADGLEAYGCAAPSDEVTGETAAMTLRALRERLIPLLDDADAADLEGSARRAAAAAPEAPAARAALDIALHDLAARRAGMPLAALLGARRDRLPTSITLGIADPGTTLAAGRRHLAAGFRILKIKLGEDWEADAALVRALRDALGPGVILRADGNQGYSEEEARRFLGALRHGDLELLEQPVRSDDLQAMARLASEFELPLMADESVRTAADARRVVAAGAADMINVKLMKAGGIGEALAVARLAAGAGLGVMFGCNDESRVGIAAALHCALAAPGAPLADLDGHLDLADDVAHGGVLIEEGCLLPVPGAIGLGVSVDLRRTSGD